MSQNDSRRFEERYAIGAAGGFVGLAGTGGTFAGLGQGANLLGYSSLAAKSMGISAAATSGGIYFGAATGTLGLSYTGTRGVDYATGNRISKSLATAFWFGYETIGSPYN